MIAETCDWLNLSSLSGVWRCLRREGIHYKRGRAYIHSPDLHYDEKLALIQAARQQVMAEPERYVLLYLDEFSCYRQPSVSYDYAAQGHDQPLARLSYASNHASRIIAAMNMMTGRVTYQQCKRTGLRELNDFWNTLHKAYPLAEQIYVVLDNWPIHFHPDVLARLQPQNLPFPPRLSRTWRQEARPTVSTVTPLPIQLLNLPTYASWLNPVEKLWRWLKQEVLHLHRHSDDFSALQRCVAAFLDQFTNASAGLLRYVGLLPT
jgi:hypothetical protein